MSIQTPSDPSRIDLKDKVAIVTGSSRGIGEAIARTYARAGAKVVLASRKPEGIQAVADSIVADGGEAFARSCHTGRPEECEALVQAAVERYGKVDVLVNNAATNPHFGPMLTCDFGQWDKTFEVNVKGYFVLARAVAQHLLDCNGQGSIVQIASVVGTMGAPLQGIYGMTKAAVISMTKTLAQELGPAGIRVNAIAPGLVETRFAQALVNDDTLRNMILDRTALKRVAKPEDIAGTALFLASDAAAYVTGAVWTVDGGWTV